MENPEIPERVCIHCGSPNLAYSDDRRGFGAGKAIVGAVAFGPLGLLAGAIGKNKRRVSVRCNQCLRVFSSEQIIKRERAAVQRRDLAASTVSAVIGQSATMAVVLAAISYAVVDGVEFMVRFGVSFAALTALLLAARLRARQG